jgi:hypothetical protein
MPAKWKDLVAGLPAALEEAMETASRDTAEALNQAIRRISQSPTVSDALAALVDSTPSFCAAATVLSLQQGHAQPVRSKGTAVSSAPFEIATAPALSTLLETKEPVAAAATPAQLSLGLAEALAAPDDRAYLFPLKVRQEVVAALAAAGAVQAGAMECLCEAASLRLEILLPPAPPPPAPLAPPPAPLAPPRAPAPVLEAMREPSAWDSLSPEAQRLHLQAQRFARVKVAELRLYHAEAVREGRAKLDLYGGLRAEIDKLRGEFEKDFAATPAMVDYLHLEVLRTLAHDDDRLLGETYPGPLI